MKKISRKTPLLPRAEIPDIFSDKLAVMSPQELAKVRAFLLSPEWVKFLRVLETAKPSSNISKAGSGERDEFSDARANARLGEIRGWDLHVNAIFLALSEPKEVKKQVEATYPASGHLPLGT